MRNGQTVDTYDPSSTLKRAVTTGYDLRNRIDTINQGGFATDLVFDALGNLTDETDPNSAASGHNYDPLNPNDGAGVHLFAYHIDSLKKLPLAPVEPRASHRFSRFTDRGGLDEPPRQ